MDNWTVNRVEIRGRVGQEPKISTVGGITVARFSIATNEITKSKTGEIREETDWHNVTAWVGRNITDVSFIRKGAIISVTGRLKYTKYTNQMGEDKRITDIIASNVSLFTPPGTAPAPAPATF